MLETINAYIKYVYYIIGAILFVVLINFTINLVKVCKTLNVDLKGINNINDKIKAITDKTDYLKQSFSTSWAFFVEIYAIIQIIRVTLFDYKDTPKAKRSIIKSASKAIMHSSVKGKIVRNKKVKI